MIARWNPVADLPDHTEPALHRVVRNRELPGAAAKHRPLMYQTKTEASPPNYTRMWNHERVARRRSRQANDKAPLTVGSGIKFYRSMSSIIETKSNGFVDDMARAPGRNSPG